MFVLISYFRGIQIKCISAKKMWLERCWEFSNCTLYAKSVGTSSLEVTVVFKISRSEMMKFLSAGCRQPSCFLELGWPWRTDSGFFRPPVMKDAKVGWQITPNSACNFSP